MQERDLSAELNAIIAIGRTRPLDNTELGKLNDIHAVAKGRRLALDKLSNELKGIESLAETTLIDVMRAQKLEYIASEGVKIALNPVKYKPHVQNWGDFTTFILQSRDLSLLERRPSASAITERWDHGNVVPGVEKFPVYTLSRTRL